MNTGIRNGKKYILKFLIVLSIDCASQTRIMRLFNLGKGFSNQSKRKKVFVIQKYMI